MIADGKKQGYIEPSLNEEALLIYLDVLKAGFRARQDLTKNITTKTDLYMDLSRILFYGFLKKDIGIFPNSQLNKEAGES